LKPIINYIVMNPNYSSPRMLAQSHATNGVPFYHPQKDMHPNITAPNFPRSPKSSHFIPAPVQPSSKSYITKPQYEPVKPTANSSGYLKSSL
jgi:hypothetical protein